MFQRLPIALAHLKAGNNSENLLNEIRQIVYSLYQKTAEATDGLIGNKVLCYKCFKKSFTKCFKDR